MAEASRRVGRGLAGAAVLAALVLQGCDTSPGPQYGAVLVGRVESGLVVRVLTCAAPSQSVVGLTVYEWPDDEEVGWDSARFRSRAPVIGDVDLSLTAVLSPAWQPVQEIEEGPPRRTLRPVGGFRTDSSYSISATVAGPASDRHLTLDVVFTAADLEALPVGRWLHAGSGSEETGAPPVTSSDPAALRDAACEGWTEGRTVTA